MLRTERICKVWSLNELFDDGQWCPICLGREFTFVEGEAITCDKCGASFWLRCTGGDQGVVIDCQPDDNFGRFVVPVERVVVGDSESPMFWQVLKTCNYGLGDRDHWCCNVKKESLYWMPSDGPAGKELLRFNHSTAAIRLFERWWLLHTEVGQKVKVIEDKLSGKLPRDVLDEQTARAYSDMRKELNVFAQSPGGHARRAKYEAQFRKDHLVEGFYFPEQCQAVFGSFDQRRQCVPARNQKPYQRGHGQCIRCGLPVAIGRQA